MGRETRKREGQQLLIRFPEGSTLRDQLDEIAKKNLRSLSAEIVHRLEQSLVGGDIEKQEGRGHDARIVDLETQVRDMANDVEFLKGAVWTLRNKVATLSSTDTDVRVSDTNEKSTAEHMIAGAKSSLK